MVAVLSMVRATLYRFARSRLTWGLFAAYVACIAVQAFVSSWLGSLDPGALDGAASVGGAATPTQAYGQTVGKWGAVLFTCAIVSSLAVTDFKTGAVKNVLQAKGGRLSYAASLLCATLATVVAVIAVGIAATEASFRLAGFSIEGYDAGLGLWLLQVVVVAMAYLSIVLLLCLVTKSEGFITFAIIVLCTGLLEAGVMLVLANAFDGVPAVRDCMDNCLTVQLSRISDGIVPTSFAADFLPGLAVLAVFGALCLVAMRRMDLR